MHSDVIAWWRTSPFIKIITPFIAGILFQYYYSLPFLVMVLAILGVFFLLAVLINLPIEKRYQYNNVQSYIIYVLLFFIGSYITFSHNPQNNKSWYGNFYQKNDRLLVSIQEPLEERAQSYKSTARIKGIVRNGVFFSCDGLILLYFNKKSIPKQVKYGTVLIVNKPIEPILSSGNPGAFNNQQYQAFQKKFHQVFLNKEEYTLLNINESDFLNRQIYSLQTKILSVLRKYIGNSDNLGLAEALLIGFKNDLDNSIIQTYSNAGVVHIIAISGLHLGLIYFSLWNFLGLLPFIKQSIFLKVFLTFLGLWLFTLIAGANSSVLRSAVMFSCILLGKLINKESTVLNTLASTAFILLCYNPYYLWDIGFQLSYLAIIGIVGLQQPIQRLLNIKFIFSKQIGQLLSTTLAAQIATFPICLYYFHQFPNYFILTNLIAVPLSTIILFFEVALIACSSVYFIAKPLGEITNQLIEWLNESMSFIAQFPFALTRNINISAITTLLLYVLLILMVLFAMSKRKKIAIIIIGLLFLMTLIKNVEDWNVLNQKKFIVYNTSKESTIDLVVGKSFAYLGNTSLSEKNKKIIVTARGSLQLNNILNFKNNFLIMNYLLEVNGKKIAVMQQYLKGLLFKKCSSVDVLVLSKDPSYKIQELKKVFNPQLIVLAGDMKMRQIESYKNECEKLGVPYFIVSKNGAYVLNIQ